LIQALAESILTKGQEAPILVREDGTRFVLVEGLHRLEACRALGETTVSAISFRPGIIERPADR
jgi:ParB-like chromosome segregation protein Spo0J